jgi:hypothetical protein
MDERAIARINAELATNPAHASNTSILIRVSIVTPFTRLV